jgi:hypothetical protein
VIQDELQPADVIDVLAGESDRLDYAVKLYHEGYAPRLFVTGCDCTKYREWASAGGVRPEEIFPNTSRATTTYEEALELKEFLEGDLSIQSVIITDAPAIDQS